MLKQIIAAAEKCQALPFVLCAVGAVLWILFVIARWGMFTKMGEKGWKSIIPFYGLYIEYSKCWSKRAAWDYILTLIVYMFFEFGIYKGSTQLTSILCSVGELIAAITLLYYTVRLNFRVSKAFGHGVGFGFGLWLLPYIFTFILGFGKSEYIGNPLLKKKKAK